MKIREILEVTKGKIINDFNDLDREVKGGCGADLMSDVLASIEPEAVLLTGLCNPQVVRTAVMADIAAIIMVRGKTVPQATIDLANEEQIPLISSPCGMFELSGILYNAGLPCLEKPISEDECICDE